MERIISKNIYKDILSFIDSKEDVSSYAKDIKQEQYPLAAGLFMLYEEIFCNQEMQEGKIDKKAVHDDDIFLHLYNIYKPYFSGEKIMFFDPVKDLSDKSYHTKMLDIFNYIAYELVHKNPYAMTMIKQLMKLLYPVFNEMDDEFNKDKMELTEIFILSAAISTPDILDDNFDLNEMDKSERDEAVENMFTTYLFAYVCGVEITDTDNNTEYLKSAMIVYHTRLRQYRPKVPAWMESAPDMEDYEEMVLNEDWETSENTVDKYIIPRFKIDFSRKSKGLPLYHRMNKLARRVFYFNGYDADRSGFIPTEEDELDRLNFRQAYFYLFWMYNGDTGRITQTEFEAAASLMNILNCYIEHIWHYTGNIDTLLRIEDSASAARNYLESMQMPDENRNKEISRLKNETEKKDVYIRELEKRVKELEEKEKVNDQLLSEEREQNRLLSADGSSGPDRQMDEIYAGQLREKDILIDQLRAEVKDLGRQLETMKRDNETLKEINKSITVESIRSWKKEADGLIRTGKEKEFYDGEMKEMVLEAIHDSLQTAVQPKSRRADILESILAANAYSGIIKSRRYALKQILSKDSLKNGHAQVPELEKQGFITDSDNSHIKLKFYGDSRYTITVPRSSSDNRATDNLYSTIKNLCY